MGVPRYTRLQGKTGLGQRELSQMGNLVANAQLTILSHLLASSTQLSHKPIVQLTSWVQPPFSLFFPGT